MRIHGPGCRVPRDRVSLTWGPDGPFSTRRRRKKTGAGVGRARKRTKGGGYEGTEHAHPALIPVHSKWDARNRALGNQGVTNRAGRAVHTYRAAACLRAPNCDRIPAEVRAMKAAFPALLAFVAAAAPATDFVDTAEVRSSTPIIERANERRQECGPVTEPGKKPECRTVTAEREYVKGYLVIYRYNGRDIATKLPSDPGPTVQVGIGVIEPPRARKAPSAGALGSNVREVVQPPEKPVSPATPRAPATNPDGYQYRY